MDEIKIVEVKNNMNKDNDLIEFATLNKDAIRLKKEQEDFRPPYFRDADRIIYSLAYNRFSNKTQVYSEIENDNISRRMVHVQMVSKIARTIGRALKLNEDLIEAAALGHDLGHVPFGHVGESILNKICLENNLGYFNHNIQSVRNLMYIEKGGNGSNITFQVLDAIMCHNGEVELEIYEPNSNKTIEQFLEEYNNSYVDKNACLKMIPKTLEGCVVRISDIIAYIGKDIEDARRLHLLKKEILPTKITSVLGDTNSNIIENFVNDIISNSINHNYIKLSKEKFEALKALKKFNYENIYEKAHTKEQREKWELMFRTVFNTYLEDLKNNIEKSHIYIYFYNYMNEEYKKNNTLERVVVDYIAGMTDDFLIREYKHITSSFDN